MQTQITAIVKTATDSINARREETNNTLDQLEADFASFKALVIESLVSDAMVRINERREEANVQRNRLDAEFAEYSKAIQEWSLKEIVALVS